MASTVATSFVKYPTNWPESEVKESDELPVEPAALPAALETQVLPRLICQTFGPHGERTQPKKAWLYALFQVYRVEIRLKVIGSSAVPTAETVPLLFALVVPAPGLKRIVEPAKGMNCPYCVMVKNPLVVEHPASVRDTPLLTCKIAGLPIVPLMVTAGEEHVTTIPKTILTSAVTVVPVEITR